MRTLALQMSEFSSHERPCAANTELLHVRELCAADVSTLGPAHCAAFGYVLLMATLFCMSRHQILVGRIRDETMLELGVRLEDRGDESVWKLEDADVLRREQQAKQQAAAEQKLKKLTMAQSKKDAVRCLYLCKSSLLRFVYWSARSNGSSLQICMLQETVPSERSASLDECLYV